MVFPVVAWYTWLNKSEFVVLLIYIYAFTIKKVLF